MPVVKTEKEKRWNATVDEGCTCCCHHKISSEKSAIGVNSVERCLSPTVRNKDWNKEI